MTDPQPETENSTLHLYLSPHLDDAVFSCGGHIHDLVQAGDTVIVYTVMAGEPPDRLPSSSILQDLHARWQSGEQPIAERRTEDHRALGILGANGIHGLIPDCVYRRTFAVDGQPEPLYPTEESLWGDIHPVDTAAMLLECAPLPFPQADVLHVPLGAGGHVDHKIVRNWGWWLARSEPGLTVYFYEEYPYSLEGQAIEDALAHFAPQVLEPVLRPLGEHALRAKIGAIAWYESQISTFWSDLEAMAGAVRAYARQVGNGQLAEREWRMLPRQR